MRNRKGIAGIFRVIAGGYLVYLGVTLIRDGLMTGEMQGNARIFGILASVLFIVFGAFFAIHAVRWMAKQSAQEEEEQNEEIVEVEAKPVEQQAPAAPSLFDRAGFGSSVYSEEDEEEEEEADYTEEPETDEETQI